MVSTARLEPQSSVAVSSRTRAGMQRKGGTRSRDSACRTLRSCWRWRWSFEAVERSFSRFDWDYAAWLMIVGRLLFYSGWVHRWRTPLYLCIFRRGPASECFTTLKRIELDSSACVSCRGVSFWLRCAMILEIGYVCSSYLIYDYPFTQCFICHIKDYANACRRSIPHGRWR